MSDVVINASTVHIHLDQAAGKVLASDVVVDGKSVAQELRRLIATHEARLKPVDRQPEERDGAGCVVGVVGQGSEEVPGDGQRRVDPQGEVVQVGDLGDLGVAHGKAPLRAGRVLDTPDSAVNVREGSDSVGLARSSPESGAVGDPDESQCTFGVLSTPEGLLEEIHARVRYTADVLTQAYRSALAGQVRLDPLDPLIEVLDCACELEGRVREVTDGLGVGLTGSVRPSGGLDGVVGEVACRCHENAPLRADQVLDTPGSAVTVGAGSDSPSSIDSSSAGAVGDPAGAS